MTGSQIKEEAPGTNTLKMAEIEANDQWSLRSTMQGARIWLPNIEGFFFFLWAGYWKVQKGKGTMRPMTRLNFLAAVYEKTKGLLSL